MLLPYSFEDKLNLDIKTTHGHYMKDFKSIPLISINAKNPKSSSVNKSAIQV